MQPTWSQLKNTIILTSKEAPSQADVLLDTYKDNGLAVKTGTNRRMEQGRDRGEW